MAKVYCDECDKSGSAKCKRCDGTGKETYGLGQTRSCLAKCDNGYVTCPKCKGHGYWLT